MAKRQNRCVHHKALLDAHVKFDRLLISMKTLNLVICHCISETGTSPPLEWKMRRVEAIRWQSVCCQLNLNKAHDTGIS